MLKSVSWHFTGGSSCSASAELRAIHPCKRLASLGETSTNRNPACAEFPSQANSAARSKAVSLPGKVKATCHLPEGRPRLGMLTAIPPSLKSEEVTLAEFMASRLRIGARDC